MSTPRSQENRQTSFGLTNARAKRLRADMPATEKKFWNELRAMQGIEGKFRRQAPIGPYAVDFVHHGAKLAIELDGPHHESDEARAFDRKKDDWLKAEGFTVLRFDNSEVWDETDRVLEQVRCAIGGDAPSPLTPLPRGERGSEGGAIS